MGDDWVVSTIEDAPLEIIDGDRGVNYPAQADFNPSGHCLFLNAGNVTTNGFNFSECAFISAEKDMKLRKGKLSRYDVVLTTRGTVGNVAYFDESVSYDHIRINSGMVIFRVQPQELLPRYLYLFVRSSSFQSQVASLCTGSAQPQLPIRDINRIEIPIPPLPKQRAIAHIFGTLDDKIELNRRMNETLEATARAVFKSWFVDFDPVRAEAEGRDSGLPKHIADLFPARLMDSELGDLLTLQRGFDLPTSARRPGPYPVIAANGSNGSHDEFMARGPGVTTGRSGVLGNVFYVHDDFWPLNTSLWVKEFKRSTPAYAFYLLRRLDFGLFNAGSAVPTLNRNHVHNLPTLMPPVNLIHAFDTAAVPLLTRQRINDDESRNLGALRAWLLPKLFSGELRLSQDKYSVRMATTA